MCRSMQRIDINSASNYESAVTKHSDIEVSIDFERNILSGTTTITLESREAQGVAELVLDTSLLEIHRVFVSDSPARWDLKPLVEPNGRPLHITLDNVYSLGETFTVDFQTKPNSTGLQWFKPGQTDDKKYPFMFSQCEPVHARSIFPCQDTPSIKTTFTIRISSVLPVVASGVPEHDLVFPLVNDISEAKIYTFQQTVPISNYLFSIASGNLVGAQITPRSYLYCAPGDLEACKAELQPDLEAIMASAEKLIYEYPWPWYNLVILPKSFHLGGMENPVFNFYSATVISGDRENISVVAHEFAHSYSGNLVTNASWEHFWLNEGWTVYIERHILRELRGEDERTFHSIVGWQDLLYGIESYGGDQSPSTRLVLDFEGQRPDDVMSKISYEKGYTFLCYLESILGQKEWLRFVPHYFKTFFCKSVDSSQFKSCLFDFYASDAEAISILERVDWEAWYHKPGAPPKPNFQCKLYDDCIQLTNRWTNLSTQSMYRPSPQDMRGWTVAQILVFLDTLIRSPNQIPLDYVKQLESVYGLAKSKNLEVISRYLRVALRANDRDAIEPTRKVLAETGRMKFVRPLFECLIAVDGKIASETFQELKDFYHPTCVRLIENVLHGKGLLQA
ncbi:unnamed protein product [Clonostachys byssicola]|uniref:Peptidase M1 leukotriene A4 hydrolase/aminopeptidase C-terminal domain-containing protein n=1 Tax=Clonostachys byssicola TaxID=160290 RepID=A0A9N9U2T9_9HYPO|nr:unnamed protein product [Clonostachys byssicola]